MENLPIKKRIPLELRRGRKVLQTWAPSELGEVRANDTQLAFIFQVSPRSIREWRSVLGMPRAQGCNWYPLQACIDWYYTNVRPHEGWGSGGLRRRAQPAPKAGAFFQRGRPLCTQ